MRNFVLFSIIILFLLSCKKNKNNIPVVKIPDNTDVVITLDKPSQYQVIPLETHKDGLLKRIIKILFYNDKFYILDDNRISIYVFNKEGKYLTKLNKKGKGPGEFISIMNFTIYEKKLFLVCKEFKVNLYDADNFNYLSTFKTNNICALDIYVDKENICLGQLYKYNQNNKVIYFLDKNYNIKLKQFDFKYSYFSIYKALQAGTIFGLSSERNTILFSQQYDNIIYKLIDGKFQPIYKVDLGKFVIPEDILESDPNTLENYKNNSNSKYFLIDDKFIINRYLMMRLYSHLQQYDLSNSYLVVDTKDNNVSFYKKIICKELNSEVNIIAPYSEGFISYISSNEIQKQLYFINEKKQKKETLAEWEQLFLSKFTNDSNPCIVLLNWLKI